MEILVTGVVMAVFFLAIGVTNAERGKRNGRKRS